MTYAEAMSTYGSDKPDRRFGLEIREVSAEVADSEFRVFADIVAGGGSVHGFAVPGLARELSRKRLDGLQKLAAKFGARGLVPIQWISAEELKSPLLKALGADRLKALATAAGGNEGDAVLLVGDAVRDTALGVLGQLRLHIGAEENLIDRSIHRPLWVTEFPLFGPDERGGLTPLHHPFTAVHPEDLDSLESNPENARSIAYDLALDGEEVAGGSIRIHRRDVQEKVFAAIGLDAAEAERRFGFLLRALSYGAPPHGGIAIGVDRVAMIVSGEESIRDVIAFPKTTTAQDLLTEAPSPVDEAQLSELGLSLRKT